MLEVGKKARVVMPGFVGYDKKSYPEEIIENVTITAINVPCKVALGLLGTEVRDDKGMIYHVDTEHVHLID